MHCPVVVHGGLGCRQTPPQFNLIFAKAVSVERADYFSGFIKPNFRKSQLGERDLDAQPHGYLPAACTAMIMLIL